MNRRRLAVTLITAVLSLVAACGGEQRVLPTATPEAETKTKTQARTVSAIEPQTQALMLRLNSPEVNLVTGSDRVLVSGVTSPDATLSVNGRLVFPDAQGRFSIGLDRPEAEYPMVIEVVATSIIGESESRLRPVIFSRRSGSGKSGIFGTVTAVEPSEITLLTGSGPVTLSVGAATMVRIHGWESPSVSDIDLGTLAAVLTDGPRAVSVLAVSGRPVRTRHFTGLVAGLSPNGSLTLRDNSGRQVTVNVNDGVNAVAVDELVTAVLEQDLASGALAVTAIDGASESARRLFAALDLNLSSGGSLAQDNLSALRWRLTEHSASHLSNLIAMDTGPLAAARQLYGPVLTKHRAGKPSADVTGMVTLLNSATGQITVQPEQGGPVTVRVGQTTPVALLGERIRSGQLDLASRVSIRYSLSGMDASRVAVFAGNTLPDDSSLQLAQSAGRGELQGILIDAGSQAFITILDRATGRQIPLIAADATVFRDGAPAVLDSDMEGTNVFARFDPDTRRLLELESIALLRGDELVSGVVHSFIPKVAKGNLTIRTPNGRLRSFTHNINTVIRRDGLRVPINEVRIGDLVRPNTRVRPPDTMEGQAGEGRAGEIVVLSLKAPEPGLVTGIIRGVNAGPDGYARITLSDIWLELISLKVGPGTDITQQGRTLAVRDLAVGQEVTFGSYDPVTLVAAQLKLDPPRVEARASLGR